MSKINVLDSSVYNKIAAGEVVERPASIVKELVENSLDAGADSISIEIEGGGMKRIVVSDNGGGIERDDFIPAFLPHATSKLRIAEDLSEIVTLGFRGEALSSIASVSRVRMTSKTMGDDVASSILVDGGKIGDVTEWAGVNGTRMEVRDLFFNTPARAKFLKGTKQEEREITNLVSRYILVKPDVKFRYIADGELIFQSNATGLLDSIFVIYGKEAVENILPISNTYKGLTVSGFIGNPKFTKANKTYQTVSLNGRYIQNSQISIAAHNAFSEYLMKRSYPFYVINIEAPLGSVDVNVHPNKMDVRFENQDDVFSLVYRAVRMAIDIYNRNQVASLNDLYAAMSDTYLQNDEKSANKANYYPINNTMPDIADDKYSPIETEFVSKQVGHADNANFADDLAVSISIGSGTVESETSFDLKNNQKDSVYVSKIIKDEPRTLNDYIMVRPPVCAQETMDMLDYKLIGQLFSTYILVEFGNALLLIDQHAGHERLIYDDIVKNFEQNVSMTVQTLLIPYVFTVNALERSIIENIQSDLNKFGFQIEEFGDNAYRVSSIPVVLSEIKIDLFIQDILKDGELTKKYNADIVFEKLMKKACKSAVKAGDSLSDFEIKNLLKNLKTGSVMQCPHGRPIVYQITKNEIEKWFKRVL